MSFKLNKRAVQPLQTPASLAWCAGFYDGDGCTSISKQQMSGRKNLTYRLRATVAQNCIETLWHFQAVMSEQSFATAMKTQPDYTRRMYVLVYEGRHAVEVLRKMVPHMIRKRAGAEAALQFWVDGQMGTLPGPKGLPPEVWKAREYWYQRLPRLAGR